jgi:hypothetical protein
MKLQKILFGLLLVTGANNFAMNSGLEQDDQRFQAPAVAVDQKKICKFTYPCQLYLSAVDYYMNQTHDRTLFRAEDEVKNPKKKTIIAHFLQKVVPFPFTSSDGSLITPNVHEKTKRKGLSTLTTSPNFVIAQSVARMLEGKKIDNNQLDQGFDAIQPKMLPGGFSGLCSKQPQKSKISPIDALDQRMTRLAIIAPGGTPSSADVVHGLQHLAQDINKAGNQWLDVERRKITKEDKKEYQAKRFRPHTWPLNLSKKW